MVLYKKQTEYINKILKHFMRSIDKQRNTSLPPNIHIHNESEVEEKKYVVELSPSSNQLYQQKIGSLLYLAMTTRPDMAWAESLIGRFASNPQNHHHLKLNHILPYLDSSKSLYLQLKIVCRKFILMQIMHT